MTETTRTVALAFDPATTPLAREAMEKLLGQWVQVTKGNTGKGLRARDKGKVTLVRHNAGQGFLIGIRVHGRDVLMWAQSPARFSGDTISLNTGDPTQTAKFRKIAAP